MKVYFQIGTNNGNDLFNKKCKKDKPDKIILVEPNQSLYNQIKQNYKDISNVSIYMNSIYYKSNEKINLYIPELQKNSKIAVNNISYSDVHYTIYPMNDWGNIDNMEKIESTTITFDDICKQENITNIEYLQIDTEGFDYEIIKMIDLSSYNIKNIRFEKWLFNPNVYTKNFNDKADNLGINGYNIVLDKLKLNGYLIKDIIDEDGNDSVAYKIN